MLTTCCRSALYLFFDQVRGFFICGPFGKKGFFVSDVSDASVSFAKELCFSKTKWWDCLSDCPFQRQEQRTEPFDVQSYLIQEYT